MAPCYRNLKAQGGFQQLRGDSGQDKKLRSPERTLCSPGMPETRRPTVHHNQYPHTPRNMWGRVDGWMVGGGGGTFQPHRSDDVKLEMFFLWMWSGWGGGGNFAKLHTVGLVLWSWVCVCLFFYVCFNREAKGIRAFQDFLVPLVIAARRARG